MGLDAFKVSDILEGIYNRIQSRSSVSAWTFAPDRPRPGAPFLKNIALNSYYAKLNNSFIL
jgi:hypothetical protein